MAGRCWVHTANMDLFSSIFCTIWLIIVTNFPVNHTSVNLPLFDIFNEIHMAWLNSNWKLSLLTEYCLRNTLHEKRYTRLLEPQFKLLSLMQYSLWVLKDLNISIATPCFHTHATTQTYLYLSICQTKLTFGITFSHSIRLIFRLIRSSLVLILKHAKWNLWEKHYLFRIITKKFIQLDLTLNPVWSDWLLRLDHLVLDCFKATKN